MQFFDDGLSKPSFYDWQRLLLSHLRENQSQCVECICSKLSAETSELADAQLLAKLIDFPISFRTSSDIDHEIWNEMSDV